MKDIVLAWFSVILLLVFVYLVVTNPLGTTAFLKSLSYTNTNAILALQGHPPQTGVFGL